MLVTHFKPHTSKRPFFLSLFVLSFSSLFDSIPWKILGHLVPRNVKKPPEFISRYDKVLGNQKFRTSLVNSF